MEMGISLPGEMRRLSSVVRPDMAVFMNIGDSHLEALATGRGYCGRRLRCWLIQRRTPL